MSSGQLHDLTQQELVEHAYSILSEAMEVWREAQNRATRNAARTAAEAAEAAAEAAGKAAEAASVAAAMAGVGRAEVARAARAEAIANLDILHRQQMIGEWPFETNQAVVDEAMNRAGKLSKRHFKKNKIKTKRRRMHKNTKRRRL
jgi:hypothetical protein